MRLMWCSRGCVGPHAISDACLWHVSIAGGATRRGCAAVAVSEFFNGLPRVSEYPSSTQVQLSTHPGVKPLLDEWTTCRCAYPNAPWARADGYRGGSGFLSDHQQDAI